MSRQPPPLAMATAQPVGGGGQPQFAQAQTMPMQGGGQPQFAQAQAMPAGGQMAMQAAGFGGNPAPHASGGGGGAIHEQMLPNWRDCFVKQAVDLFEAMTGWEEANKYQIFNSGGQTMNAFENSTCMMRQFCGNVREFQMKVQTSAPGGGGFVDVLTIDRPMRCKTGCCYLQEMTVKDSAGRVIGRVEQQFSLCAADISLRVGSAVEYKVAGPCCVCDGPFCGDQVFHILDKSGQPAGDITKQGTRGMGDMVAQAMTDADNFGCTFPASASADARAVILACIFLIDFMFFEDGGEGPGGGHHDD